jgi:shikimate dehydrogenase
MDRYVVIGNPVAHSRSPLIHSRFAAQMGESIDYERLFVALGAFDEHARRFFGSGGRGANVTLPFKVDAYRFAHARSDRARAAGAANLLAAREDGIFADNTDGAGLVADLVRNLGVAIAGRRVLLAGAGGAARGVVAPLLAERPALLAIANRTPARALDLATRFANAGPIEAIALDAVREPFDLIVNATSSSTHGESLVLPQGVIAKGAFVYDMAYGEAASAFLEHARGRGARVSDGLGMLVEQAAESWFVWRGTRPQTAGVLAELRSE